MSTMKVSIIESFGEPAKVLKAENVPIPEPKFGEVRIKMVLSPVHNHDILTVRGEYGALPETPFIGGTEAIGIVDAHGPDVTEPVKGTRVAVARTTTGTWAEFFIAPAKAVKKIPDNISDEIGAQLSSMPMSALMAVDDIDPKPGEWIVVNAANGAVGKTIAQIAKARNVNVASIVKRETAKTELEKFNISPVFVSDQSDWVANAAKHIDGPVVGGVDMVGGQASYDLVSLVGENGVVLSFGGMSNEPMKINPSDLIFKQISIKGFWASQEIKKRTPAQIDALFQELIKLAESNKLHLPVQDIFDIEQITSAGKAYYEERNGKLMISGRKK